MTKSRIRELARLMPESTSGPLPPIFPSARQMPEPLLASAVTDPSFGNRFVRAFVSSHQPLPPCVHESSLRRAYQHYARTNAIEDQVMEGVVELLCDENHFTASVLKALLVCRDATCQQIADWLCISVDVVQLYEQLHFNVRDRADEGAYMASIIFPYGRMQLLKTDSVDNLPMVQRLLQAGYLHGADEVLILAGMNTDAELPSQEESKREFEASILANANRLARNGYLNSTSSPGINHAKSILATQAQASQQAVVTDDYKIGLGSLNMSPKDVIRSPADAIQYTLDGIRAHQNGQTVKQMTDEELAKEDEEIRAMHQAVLKANKAAVN